MNKPTETSRKTNIVIFFFTLMIGVSIIFACGPPDSSRGNQAKRGFDHYKTHCASCHGNDGKGIKVDSLVVQPADLTRITARRRIADFPIMPIAKIIDGRTMVKGHGTRQMPIWGEVFSKQKAMTEDEIRGDLGEIIAFLMTIQRS